ncbi:DUF3592 domain-containing protein [Chryseobacterium lactis]|uniref:DUF3592 domain-containing protein n=1 Tax=Chryseobacterium lactis TaxID=1241981 RepID=A0A3G6RJ68_CHRLC|nr:DUF3592 domain-containing protein [Chryseobacterium lactis]AZA84624.1 DUF3592 domain-containing protein [Chryseobacterium lactis]AZB05012.1 DUF3592 domain-containing protein [Chryseobacterium lactis]PNW14743.1 DUF3592 domain-containing protein [Chryseobacterium lactis]
MNIIKKKIMWQYYLMLGAGLILFILALFSFKNTLSFLKTAEKVTGTVTSLREVDSDGLVYFPVFTYRAKNNIEYTYGLAEGSNPPGWSVGDTETIIYDPEDPARASLYTYFRIFAWPLIFVSVALPLLVIGGGYFIAEHYLK